MNKYVNLPHKSNQFGGQLSLDARQTMSIHIANSEIDPMKIIISLVEIFFILELISMATSSTRHHMGSEKIVSPSKGPPAFLFGLFLGWR